jgi:proline iminopeptidase
LVDRVRTRFHKDKVNLVAHEQETIAFDEEYLKFGAPVYFLSGRYDRRADSGLAQTHLSEIEAPKKAFVWFENSAHSPPFEEPEVFNAWIISHLGVCCPTDRTDRSDVLSQPPAPAN